MKNSLALYIGRNVIDFPHINRSLDINELEYALKMFFPLIYDSYKRGNGLALKIIKYLGEHGNATIYKLSKECNASEPATINIVRRMEKRGYLKHEKIAGRGPKGAYIYELTELGYLAYNTLFNQKITSFLIELILSTNTNIPQVKYYKKIIKNNYDLFKDKAFREIIDYLFIKWIPKYYENLEQLFQNRYPYILAVTLLDKVLTYIIALVIVKVQMARLPKQDAILYCTGMLGLMMKYSTINYRPIEPEYIGEIVDSLKDLDNNLLKKIFSLALDYIRHFSIEISWIIIKESLVTSIMIRILRGDKFNEEVKGNKVKDLLMNIEKYLGELINEVYIN